MQESWQKRLWKLWKLVVRLIGYVLVASAPIIIIAFVSIFLWALAIGPALQRIVALLSIASEQKQYLEFAVGQLADWTWRVILLGAFAALMYEQIKRRERLESSGEAVLTQLQQVLDTQTWDRLDELYREYIGLGSEARNPELRHEMARAFYERTIDSKVANWQKAYASVSEGGWLVIAKTLDPLHEGVLLLLEFPTNIKSGDVILHNKVLKCIENLAPELLARFMRYHIESVRIGIRHNEDLKAKLETMIRAKRTKQEKYLLHYILLVLPQVDSITTKFLNHRLIDEKHFREGALRGIAELEPRELAHFSISQITCVDTNTKPEKLSCVADFVELALQPKHFFIIGAEGDGKTFLNRQIEYWTLKIEPHWILVNWDSFITLAEKGETSIPSFLQSFVEDLGKTLKSHPRFEHYEQLLNWSEFSGWRAQLDHLKGILRAEEIAGMFVSIDNLYKYRELCLDHQLVELLIACLFRPELEQDAPSCFLRLFMEQTIFQAINQARSPWTVIETLNLKWDETQKKEIIKRRVGTIQEEGAEPIPERELDNMVTRARSARELILEVNQYYAQERLAYVRHRM